MIKINSKALKGSQTTRNNKVYKQMSSVVQHMEMKGGEKGQMLLRS